MKIFTPIVEKLNLQIRFNLKSRNVEIKVSTTGAGVAVVTCSMWPWVLVWSVTKIVFSRRNLVLVKFISWHIKQLVNVN